MKSTTLQPYWRSTKVTIIGSIIGILACIPFLLPFGTEEKDFNQPIPSLLAYIVSNLTMLIYGQASLKTKAILTKAKAYDFVKFFPLFFVFFIAMDVWTFYIKLPSFSDTIFKDQINQNPSLFFVSIAIAAPILEELIFRGVILSYLLGHKSEWAAILFSALLFGLVHLSPDQMFFAFFAGIFLGYVYIKSQNILVPIFFHALNNAINFVYMHYGHSSFLDFFNN
jgi:membrane protease YdiL (CAAX protease family)